MSSVNQQVKSVKTKHPCVYAIISSYWEPYGVSIDFTLYNKKLDKIRIEKSYTPSTGGYLEGRFSNSDIMLDYGKRFNQWIKEVNKRKCLRW